MSRPKGSIIGARPTWTTTATSGIWTLRQAEEMKAANQWPRGPVAPTSLAGTGSHGEVALTWTAPATTHGTITDYVVEYTPAAGSPTVVATGSTAAAYTLTGLTNDTEYTIRVAGVNHTRGDWSSSVAVTPVALPAPTTGYTVSGFTGNLDGYLSDSVLNGRYDYDELNGWWQLVDSNGDPILNPSSNLPPSFYCLSMDCADWQFSSGGDIIFDNLATGSTGIQDFPTTGWFSGVSELTITPA